jgi:hypothetical protein
MTAQPGERTVSWLDEDDPNRGSERFVPVESVVELTPTAEEVQPGRKSRRDKPPKPPKPPRGKLWRRQKATQEKPPRENPPRDVTPRTGDWPAPASEDWLTTLRRPASRQEWAASRDTKPRDAGPAPEWTEAPDEAPRSTGPHPAWAAAPEDALDDDGWTTTPPLPSPPPDAAAAAPAASAPAERAAREDWFTPRDDARGDEPDRPEWTDTPPRGEWDAAPGEWGAAPEADWDQREAGARADWDESPGEGRDAPAVEDLGRPDWVRSPEPAARPEWVTSPEPAARPEWDAGPEGEPDRRRAGWDSGPEHPNGPAGWDSGPEPDRRVGWGGGAEQKARPDWVTSPVPAAPAAAPDSGWAAAEPREAAVPEAWPAPLDITPDDDLDDPPTKRRRRPRPSGPPTGERSGGRTGGGGPRRRRKPLMVLAIALTAVVAAAAVVAAGTIYRLVFDPETPGSHTIAAPLGQRTKGELELATGADTVTVSGADLGDALFQVTTPEAGDAIPLATIRGDRTTVTLASNRGEAASAVEIRLNSRVTWRLILTAGAKTQTVDLGAGKLSGLEMAGGATRLELTLPKPAGTVPIRLRGGLDELLVHAPKGALTRVKVTKGATNVTLDRLNRSKVAPDTTFTPDGWAQAKARYDVDAAEGIGTVKLDRR